MRENMIAIDWRSSYILSPVLRSLAIGVSMYVLTSLPVAIGLLHGVTSPLPGRRVHQGIERSLCDRLRTATTRVDGKYYIEIARSGYTYVPGQPCTVTFFPLYPSMVASFSALTALDVDLAAVVVSNVSLVLAMTLMHYHFSKRLPNDRKNECLWIVAAFGLYPPGFFMRMAYSEATFALLVTLLLHAVHCRWPPLQQAAIVGIASAARPVGVCLVVPVLLSNRIVTYRDSRLISRGVPLAIITLSGLFIFMAYQWMAFGNPIAFVHAQEHYHVREPCGNGEWLQKLLTLEPIWNVYTGAPPHVVKRFCGDVPRIVCLAWANPLYWLCALVLVGIGASKKWISPAEAGYGITVLVFSYVFRAYEMGMLSQGRHSIAALPMFTVIGCLLFRSTFALKAVIALACAVMLALYASQFAQGYGLL